MQSIRMEKVQPRAIAFLLFLEYECLIVIPFVRSNVICECIHRPTRFPYFLSFFVRSLDSFFFPFVIHIYYYIIFLYIFYY